MACDHFDDFGDEMMDESGMPELDDDIMDPEQFEDDIIHDDAQHFTSDDESAEDMAATFIVGGMILGQAYEDSLDHRESLRHKKKK